ncbi:MAG: sugar transferase [Actinobacteria bacterium]|uniref:Unannotated protein n=1 Tax=freshwater metagenome TaxID=449393 RepID=A0A6J5YX92_9ZZZZ|nr:sugar transferase [Actinomycetota bacterium]
MLRRAFDLVTAGGLLILSFPVILAALIAIPLESRGSPIFRQRRVGLGGEEFELIKLRTMVSGAESLGSGLAVAPGDDRITRLGALLRRTSIDELPNLVNVLGGQMSIIGPRPTVAAQVEQYTPRQRGRLAVRPGITGWAQVNGRAGLSWDERIDLDLWYIENRSWKVDRQILRRTFRTVFGGEDLYRENGPAWNSGHEDD